MNVGKGHLLYSCIFEIVVIIVIMQASIRKPMCSLFINDFKYITQDLHQH